MILLLQSALRALLLGACIWSLLRALRLRDARTETSVWTLVLLVSLAMPLLMPWAEARLPGLPLPAQPLAAQQPSAPTAWAWLGAHAALFRALYLAMAAALLARLALGLVLGLGLWRRAVPIAPGLRISPALRSPMVFGGGILLPPQWQDWDPARRDAVLAHEQCHVRRGDFFLQLGARIYCALFWFSPFSWWLLRELCVLAESASDAAAVRRMGDRASYAELLLEVARQARPMAALVAMAKGPDIAWRVDRILDGGPERALGGWVRGIAAATVLAASLGIAGAHAVSTRSVIAEAHAVKLAQAAPGAMPLAATTPAPLPRPVRVQPHSGPRYDPRALLRDPQAIMVRGLIVTTSS